ncbi:MAG: FHA domain-containing protein [Myxococcota bacterium]
MSRGEITIGRMEGNTIRLMERNVSRRHARLLRDNGAVFIEDLNSFNGVKINGERIDKRFEVKEGDLVEIGDYHLALQAVEVEDDATSRVESIQKPHENNGKSEAWRAAATLPDVSLPEDVLAEARRAYEDRNPPANGQESATANMRPNPIGPPDPLVSPPPSKPPARVSSLPPFPATNALTSPSGLAPSTMIDGQLQARAKDDIAHARTEQIQVGPQRVSDVPRLICVSTEYAGREFPLNRPEVIIGRVEDNDVIIEHRSVSRNHAKILFDGRVHKIIDLESANGILVNGEEYAITDLRKGDLIELGHVRFRFIPAGEAFAPTDDESRAMLDAGVSPPMGAEAPKQLEPPTVPLNTHLALSEAKTASPRAKSASGPTSPGGLVEMSMDPSTAATVTDTPISALGVQAMFQPKVALSSEVPTERPPNEARQAPQRRDTEPEVPTRPPVRMGGALDTRRVPTGTMDEDSDVRPQPQKASKVAVALIIVGILLAGLVTVMYKLLATPTTNYDQELESLYQQKQWAKVTEYFGLHMKQFSNSNHAAELYAQAVQHTLQKPPPSADPTPSQTAAPSPTVEATAPPTPDPTAAPSPVPSQSAAPSPTPDVPEGDDPADTPQKGQGANSKDKKKAPKAKVITEAAKQKAEGYYKQAVVTHGYGDPKEAKHLVLQCLELNPDHAHCHRLLGVLFAGDDRTKDAIQQYQLFLNLAPSDPYAPEARKILERFKSGAE